jgi:hypothetical protein
MHALAIHVTDPFDYSNNLKSYEISEGTSIRKQAIHFAGKSEFSRPTICVVNNKPVLRQDWDNAINRGDNVVFLTLPQGDAGDSGKVLRVVLFVALVVVANVYGAQVGTALGLTGATAAGVGSTLITVAGSVLINRLLPPPKPQSSDALNSLSAASPTYSLSSQGNLARLGSAIPSLYGKHLIYPDFASTPYSQFIDNDQFLQQLFVIGQGYYTIESIKIEDTPIENFPDVEFELVLPGESLDLFQSNVLSSVEVSGQELEGPNNEGDWVGPFVLAPPRSLSTHLEIDIFLSRGLFKTDSNGNIGSSTVSFEFQVRRIDDRGTSFGEWHTVLEKTITMSTVDPQRISYRVEVPFGRHEVRGKRTNNKDNSASASNNVHWGGARSYLLSEPNYEGLTLLAVKLRATDSLSAQSSRKINCVAQRLLPTWSPSGGWTARQATSSISWAFVDVCKASYGGKLPDSKIDLNTLYELDQIWSDRGDSFNAVFDRKHSIWESLTHVARCGRAIPLLKAGVITLSRDQKRDVVSGMFTMRNILKNTLNVSYVMPSEEVTDRLQIEYFDERTWTPRNELIEEEDSTSELVAKVQLFGCTSRDQARREGLYLLKTQRLRRKTITFQTELEGFIPTYGSDIVISHDMPAWGTSGDIIGKEGLTFETSIPLSFEDSGGTYYAAFRKRDGSLSGPFEATKHAEINKFTLSSDPGIEFALGDESEQTHFAFGKGEEWSTKARVAEIKPLQDLNVEIVAVEEVDEVHVDIPPITADNLKEVELTISNDVANYDVFSALGFPEYPIDLKLTIAAGVTVYSINNAAPALRIVGFHEFSKIEVNNNGSIIGAGGAGGGGGQTGRNNGEVGKDGGDALLISLDITLKNSNGYLFGGGGGGGGGGLSTRTIDYLAGGGGGGGAGNYNSKGGSGGSGTPAGPLAPDGSGVAGPSAGGAGTTTGGEGGQGGRYFYADSFGTPPDNGGAGGDGGDYGEDGQNGGTGDFPSQGTNHPGSAGGKAGWAVINVTESQFGAIAEFDAGGDSPDRVKGQTFTK